MHTDTLADIAGQVGADAAAIMAPDLAGKHLYCHDSYNMPQEWVELKNPMTEKIPGGNVEVYHTGTPAVTNHLQKEIAGHYIESVLIVPIRRDDRTIATLELIHIQKDKEFSASDLYAAEDFADRIDIYLAPPQPL